jgi:hypothetical protein
MKNGKVGQFVIFYLSAISALKTLLFSQKYMKYMVGGISCLYCLKLNERQSKRTFLNSNFLFFLALMLKKPKTHTCFLFLFFRKMIMISFNAAAMDATRVLIIILHISDVGCGNECLVAVAFSISHTKC